MERLIVSNTECFLRKKAAKHRYSWLENVWASSIWDQASEDKMNSELTLSKTEQKEPDSVLKVDFQKAFS